MTDTKDTPAPIAGLGDRVTMTITGKVNLVGEDMVWIEIDGCSGRDLTIDRAHWDAIADKAIKPYVRPLTWKTGDVVGFYDPSYCDDMVVVKREDGQWHSIGGRMQQARYDDTYVNDVREDGKLTLVIGEGRLVPPKVEIGDFVEEPGNE